MRDPVQSVYTREENQGWEDILLSTIILFLFKVGCSLEKESFYPGRDPQVAPGLAATDVHRFSSTNGAR